MENTKTIFGVIGILLTIIGYIPYIRDTIKNKTTPHAFTWFIFGLANIITFALQLSAGGGIGSFVTFTTFLATFFVFGLSLFKGEKHITRTDVLFLVLTLIALACWIFANQPIISAILLALINILAFGPTVRKSWNQPFSETLPTYVINSSRQGLGLLALQNYNIVTYLFPLSSIIITISFILFLIIRRKILKQKQFAFQQK